MSKVGKYLKVTCLHDAYSHFLHTNKGDTLYWRINVEYENGDIIVSHGDFRTHLSKKELEAGMYNQLGFNANFKVEIVNRKPSIIARLLGVLHGQRTYS